MGLGLAVCWTRLYFGPPKGVGDAGRRLRGSINRTDWAASLLLEKTELSICEILISKCCSSTTIKW